MSPAMFPARAGMNRSLERTKRLGGDVPRTRGDEPQSFLFSSTSKKCASAINRWTPSGVQFVPHFN